MKCNHPRITVVSATRKKLGSTIAEVWHRRDLILILAWRDVRIRYRQTLLGFVWAVLPPFFLMVVFSLIFGGLAKMPSDGFPYPIFVYAALVPWQMFSRLFAESSNSMVANLNLIKKVYFPRIIVHIVPGLAVIFDFCAATVVLLAMMVFYDIYPSWPLLLLPLFVVMAVLSALSFGLWLTMINVALRDVQLGLPYLGQLWFFLTPVVYPGSIVPAPWAEIQYLNPMTVIIEGFRWSFIGTEPPEATMLFLSAAISCTVLISGLAVFNRFEGHFADRL